MQASFVYPENTPTTKEAYYYRTIFEKFFPKVGLCTFYLHFFFLLLGTNMGKLANVHLSVDLLFIII